MERKTLIDLVETKHRMRIEPNDSVFLLATISEILTAEAQAKAEKTTERMEAAAARIVAADSNKPLLTSQQIKFEILPRVITATRVAMALLLVAALLIGAGAVIVAGRWMLTCNDQPDGSRVCYYYLRQPTLVAPQPQATPAPAKPETKPTQSASPGPATKPAVRPSPISATKE